MPTDALAPIAGDPAAVNAAGRSLQAIAADIADTAARLRALANQTNGWKGQAATRASTRIVTVPPKLDKAHASYASAGAALVRYARTLADVQYESTRARSAAVRANNDLRAAQIARDAAREADSRAAAAAQSANQPPPPPTAARYDAAIDDAASRLKHATAANTAAHEKQQHAARTAAAAIKDASHQGVHNKPWWRHVTSDALHWASDHWAKALRALTHLATVISALAGIAALALSVAGIFFPPLELAAAACETVSAASAAIAMLGDTVLAATGHQTWTAVGLDALAILPTGASKLARKATPALRRVLIRSADDAERHIGRGASSAAAMAEGPGKPAVVHEPWGVTRLGRDHDSIIFAHHTPVEPGEHNVVVHGLPDGWPAGVTSEDVAAAIRKHPDWHEGTPICLYSCHAASNGTAAELAALLDTSVRAPTTAVTLDFTLSAKPILDEGGIWKTFH